MKLFTIDKDGKFVQFKEQEFKEENKEVDLEILLENNLSTSLIIPRFL